MSNPISEDCSSRLHDYCTPCQCECHDYNNGFLLNKEECKALNYFLLLHGILMKEHEEQYIHILRLINGIPQFLDSLNATKSNT